ncbi:hypothetical protein Desti_1618 [Desulfomonile tiedjei DSM 6799]|uniref:Uncharacterized protein n=1 Tax=Desulfomonile tiedjei (strain ATCC 49306 / DSM 6799 / DCB-1) TaxID=706587 RepID=I4C438_DESTA|nr:hypothetical protein Desti_1618 [Desulfomonile tiedjei DSM 6799]
MYVCIVWGELRVLFSGVRLFPNEEFSLNSRQKFPQEHRSVLMNAEWMSNVHSAESRVYESMENVRTIFLSRASIWLDMPRHNNREE